MRPPSAKILANTDPEIIRAIGGFAVKVQEQIRDRYARKYPTLEPSLVTVHFASKYARVDVGRSGRYMVELSTGNIFGIKSYGTIHRGHKYGNVRDTSGWDLSEYVPFRRGVGKVNDPTGSAASRFDPWPPHMRGN
jgi:hypothetical protein